MLIYLCILFVCSLLAFLRARTDSRSWAAVLFALIFLILFVPAAIRYGIGTDYFVTYIPAIEAVQCGYGYGIEKSFIYAVSLCSLIGDSPQLVIALYAFAIYFLGLLAFNRENGVVAIPVCILMFYLFSYNCIRQALALSLLMLAYKFVMSKKLMAMLLCSVAACIVHTSAIVFLPILITSYLLSFLRPLQLVAGFCLALIILLVIDISPLIVKISAYFDRYAGYADNAFFMGKAEMSSGIGFLLQFLGYILIFVGLFFVSETRQSRVAFSLCGITMIFFACGLKLEIFRRFNFVTDFILPFAASFLIQKKKACLLSKIAGCAFVGIWLLLFLHALIVGELGGVSPNEAVPYRTIFSNEAQISF